MPDQHNYPTVAVMKGVHFKTRWADERNVTILATRYVNNGRIAIQAMCPLYDFMPEGCTEMPMEPLATCTVNLVEASCGEDEVFIKDYAENEGMEECLTKLNIIAAPLEATLAGYAVVRKFKLTQSFMDLIKGAQL